MKIIMNYFHNKIPGLLHVLQLPGGGNVTMVRGLPV
jgi:hypothetical protein